MSKTVFITGASSGFGKACAEIFAANGNAVIISGRRKDRLDSLAASLAAEHGVDVLALGFDIRDRKAVDAAVEGLAGKWRSVDVLVNNAGLALGRDYFDEASMEDWEQMLHTNVMGLLYVSKAILPLMIPRKRGHIINIGSTAGKEVYEKGNIYCASKHAVDAITKAMRIDLLQHRIKATVIHPGAAETEFSEVRFKGDQAAAKKVYEGYQPLSAEDVARVVYYCASLPDHVCINDLVMTCTAQANSFYTFKDV